MFWVFYLSPANDQSQTEYFFGIQYIQSPPGNKLYTATSIISSEGYVTEDTIMYSVDEELMRSQGCFNGVM